MAVLLLLAALPYLGVLRNDFAYAYDDKTLILDNPLVHNPHHLGALLSTTLFAGQGGQGIPHYYRPMATLGFMLCYQLFGPLAYGFHLASLLLNVAVVGVVFLLARELFGDSVAAYCCAGLFALHPVHVEAVAWISAVTDIEVTLFYLLTFWYFLKIGGPAPRGNAWAIAGMTGSFVLALLSKEQAMTLPLLATVYEHFYRGDRLQTRWWQKMLRYGPLWLVSLGYLFLRLRALGEFAHVPGVNSMGNAAMLLSAVALAGQYLGMLFWPLRLSAFHPFHASSSLLEGPVLAGSFALGLCACLFYALWKQARFVSFGMLWFFVTLAPVLNVRWMGVYVLSERFFYLPSVGFCLVVGWGFALLWHISTRRRTRLRSAIVAAACVVAALCVLRINLRLLDWRDDVTLFAQSVAAAPQDGRLHDALASAYWVRGGLAEAESQWQDSLRLLPNNPGPLNSLSILYAQEKRYRLALPLLEKAVQLSPRDSGAHLNLGAAYAETGNLDQAEKQFRAALLLGPMNFNAHNVLGKLYFDSHRLDEAELQFRQSLECEPNVAAFDHLGYIYMLRGDRETAKKAFEGALALNSADGHAHYNLGLIYAATGRTPQAIAELQAALAAEPGNPEVLAALEKLRH